MQRSGRGIADRDPFGLTQSILRRHGSSPQRQRVGRRSTAERIRDADAYLAARTGTYEYRCQRYRAAADVLKRWGLDDTHTVMDVGAGWTEFSALLHTEYGWRGRYIPVDACVDGRDLEFASLPRDADFIVCLELIEHLATPMRLVKQMRERARLGVVISTPNPNRVDVLAMDATHKTPVTTQILSDAGFTVGVRSFFGKMGDSLLACADLRSPWDRDDEQRAGRWPERAEGWDE